MSHGVHNALYGYPALLVGIRRALGADAEVSVERLSETLDVALDPFALPEHMVLRGELGGCGNLAGNAAVGLYTGVQLFNPANSGRLCVIEAINAVCVNNGQVQLMRHDTAFVDAVGAPQPTDTRVPTTRLVCQLRVEAGGDVGVQLGRLTMLAEQAANVTGFYQWMGKPFVLGPGTGVYVRNSAVNVAINSSFQWRERQALPGELNAI